VTAAAASGAAVLAGGARPDGPGYFFQLTVLAGVRTEQAIYGEEIFGPVLPIIPFDDVDEAIGMANGTRYGLAAYLWTNDLTTAVHASERLEFGMVGVNDWTPHGTEALFGGWKKSDIGHESGAEGLAEYLETKLVAIGGL